MSSNNFSTLFKDRYTNYAISVVTSRALPDYRDGLKPVQRRILWAMHEMGLGANNSRYRKVAAVVGAVLGKYHPHGDSAVHEALVRLAQPFTMRYPLVDGQGNFGSQDGDGAAAARYIEARLLNPFQNLIFTSDSDIAVLPKEDNYDQTCQEPTVLPCVVPNLLLNGSSGIAVGLATNIPPHNLDEVTRAFVAFVQARSKGKSSAEAMDAALPLLKGPDFPTGGKLIASRQDIEAFYKEGKASFALESKWVKEGNSIIFTEIPYGVDKSVLVEKVALTIESDKVLSAWVTEWVDESDDKVRIKLTLKKGSPEDSLLEEIFKKTPLREKLSFSLTFLLNNIPGKYTLEDLFEGFYQWRLSHVELKLNLERQNLERTLDLKVSLDKAVEKRVELLSILQKDGLTQATLKDEVKTLLSISDAGVTYVLNTKISSLSKLETTKLKQEISNLEKDLQDLIKKSSDLNAVIIQEAKAALKITDSRRTELVDPPAVSVAAPVLEAPAEDTFVILSQQSWARRQKTAPSDITKIRMREGDALLTYGPCTTKDLLGFITTRGRVHLLKVDGLELTTGFGSPLALNLGFQDGETLLFGFISNSTQPLALVSKKGRIAKVSFSPEDLSPTRSNGRPIFKLEDDDELVFVSPLPSNKEPQLLGIKTPSDRLHCIDYSSVDFMTLPTRGKSPFKMLNRDYAQIVFWNAFEDINLSFYKKSNFGGGKSVILTKGLTNQASSPTPADPEEEEMFDYGLNFFSDDE